MTHATSAPRASFMPMCIIALLFFIFGFVTWLNGALIPFLQVVCQLSDPQALMIASCFYFAYVVMALPMAMILEKVGYQYSMVLGLSIIALGLLGFIPAALLQEFWIFLLAQFVIGSGLTILQTAANPYVVNVGPTSSAAARIAIMGLLNKGAGILAPVLFTAWVLGGFSDINLTLINEMPAQQQQLQIESMAHQLITPYVGMAIALLILASGLSRISLPDLALLASTENNEVYAGQANKRYMSKSTIWQFPQLVLGAVALFFYVGVEVIAGDTIGLYGASIGVANATTLTSYTMGFMVLGYILGLICIPRFVSQANALRLSAIIGLIISISLLLSSNEQSQISQLLWGWTGIATLPNSVTLIALLGLANAMVWPTLWPLALAELGRFTAKGSAILIMGIAGGALMPLIYGHLAQSSSNQQAYWILLPGYLIIGFYAFYGHTMRSWRTTQQR
ncbi:glucose/galactose MFS transporter [Paraglaciecola sp. 20A4]|uniref:glucose/galactose MFS transporter n=1 Tax=Paraglaciecola sp. 20A4 TaxID=2687288 RepID=UPI00140BB5D8|nr:glucose/galactose MFS transporter [Paraglaciecola sp. 20A4]